MSQQWMKAKTSGKMHERLCNEKYEQKNPQCPHLGELLSSKNKSENPWVYPRSSPIHSWSQILWFPNFPLWFSLSLFSPSLRCLALPSPSITRKWPSQADLSLFSFLKPSLHPDSKITTSSVFSRLPFLSSNQPPEYLSLTSPLKSSPCSNQNPYAPPPAPKKKHHLLQLTNGLNAKRTLLWIFSPGVSPSFAPQFHYLIS